MKIRIKAVNNKMRKECKFCGKEPSKSRIEVLDNEISDYGSRSFDVFCNKTHLREFVNEKLKRLKG